MPKFATFATFITAARAGGALVILVFIAAATLMATRKPSGVNTGTPATPIVETSRRSTAANATDGATMPITITGCLEEHDSAFRLKDTEGDDVPRSRSWKSGFLKKGAAPISVVDATSRLRLASHAGERVRVSGTLADREMKVRSLQTVAPGCR
jgi:hypothetical protein